ncbi:MAG: hypothetical protein HGA51_05760 [Demequinaceae bacterium]|nr:hypothetical protein [Demequinaceae bacterium]
MALTTRVVVVHRRSELEELTERHATRGQVEFFLKQRGRSLASVEVADAEETAALQLIGSAIPVDWRRAEVEREDLPQFLFGPEDVVAVVGRDGLVANVAKYVGQQPVVGFNPFPHLNAGVLTPFAPASAPSLLAAVVRGQAPVEQRTMVMARTDDGQQLVALNDVYVGDAGHQSARYELSAPGGGVEAQSSSGIIVGTGTGASGWMRSLAHDRGRADVLPHPAMPSLAWFVREAWPSPFTQAELTLGGFSAPDALAVTVQSESLVLFGDGIETDRVVVSHGQRIEVGVADRTLRLVTPR